MSELFGSTRGVIKGRYALLPPEGFVPSNLPGWEKADSVVVVSPAMGAGFCQLVVTLGREGEGHGNTGVYEFFVYVVEGNGAVTFEEKKQRLESGHFAYFPPGKDLYFQGSGATGMKIVVFQKRYHSLSNNPIPMAYLGHRRDIKSLPYRGNADVKCLALVPESPRFDLAVNILTFQPGASLPGVETSIMEQGALMLEGQGICRLDADYHHVRSGDSIWTAPYCPRWFVGMGKAPISYIYYQDVNRDPI